MKHTHTKQWFAVGASIILLALVMIPIVPTVFAATADTSKYTLLEPLPDLTTNTLKPEVTLSDYVVYAFNLMIALSAVAAVFMTVWGGLQYMTTDSWQGKSDGLKRVQNALIGLVMVLLTYVILKTVNPALVAIPASLVTPLSTNLSKPVTSSFYDQLSDTISKYHVTMASIRNDINQSQAAVDGLQKQKGDLQQAYDTFTNGSFLLQNDPTALAMKAQLDQLDSQIQTEQGSIQLKVAQSVFATAINNSGPQVGSIATNYPKVLADLNDSYNDQYDMLYYGGGDPDQIQALKDNANYTEAIIKINEQIAKVNDVNIIHDGGQTWWSKINESLVPSFIPGSTQSWKDYLASTERIANSNIDTLVADYKGSITDPALVQKITDAVKAAHTQINSTYLK